jgi:hypothetical protein
MLLKKTEMQSRSVRLLLLHLCGLPVTLKFLPLPQLQACGGMDVTSLKQTLMIHNILFCLFTILQIETSRYKIIKAFQYVNMTITFVS